jgi:hypothetical protein
MPKRLRHIIELKKQQNVKYLHFLFSNALLTLVNLTLFAFFKQEKTPGFSHLLISDKCVSCMFYKRVSSSWSKYLGSKYFCPTCTFARNGFMLTTHVLCTGLAVILNSSQEKRNARQLGEKNRERKITPGRWTQSFLTRVMDPPGCAGIWPFSQYILCECMCGISTPRVAKRNSNVRVLYVCV